MARLWNSGAFGLLVLSGSMLAMSAGLARTTSGPGAWQSADPPVAGVSVYVSDFELAAVPTTKNKAPAIKGANADDRSASEAETPSMQARLLVDSLATTLQETLRKNGFAATRVREKPAGKGVLLRGVFAETDAKNRIRQAILGAGSTNPQLVLYVGMFNLKSPDQPLYEPAAVQAPDPHYGPVITLNAYIPLERFQIARNPTQEDLQKVCTQIAQNLNQLLQANKEAFAN
jgi:hypothetical protein